MEEGRYFPGDREPTWSPYLKHLTPCRAWFFVSHALLTPAHIPLSPIPHYYLVNLLHTYDPTALKCHRRRHHHTSYFGIPVHAGLIHSFEGVWIDPFIRSLPPPSPPPPPLQPTTRPLYLPNLAPVTQVNYTAGFHHFACPRILPPPIPLFPLFTLAAPPSPLATRTLRTPSPTNRTPALQLVPANAFSLPIRDGILVGGRTHRTAAPWRPTILAPSRSRNICISKPPSVIILCSQPFACDCSG